MKQGTKHGRVTDLEGDPHGASATWGRRRSGRTRPKVVAVGRTIGEARERLETANERAAARKKDKRKNNLRILFVTIGFILLALILVGLYFTFFNEEEGNSIANNTIYIPYTPTIEVVDEDASATGGEITSRMSEYIGQAEVDFRALGLTPVKAVIPNNSIREIDFYLEGYSGFIKMLLDRGTAVSVEDADRMIRYLANQGITDFEYIDVRLEGKAYWK